MLKFLLSTLVVSVAAQTGGLTCSGCNEMGSIHYQRCAMEHGDPCAEVNEAGLVSSKPGKKKDVACCMKKEKHEGCMKCKLKDCEHGTCSVSKDYYSYRTTVAETGKSALHV